MQWTQNFDLFLFDFDGLLVNTEPLHHQAYIKMMEAEGFTLDWNLEQFCAVAHRNATALKEALYVQFPTLDPDWKRLYALKKQMYEEVIVTTPIELMPGVESLLKHLAKNQVRRCVVTNSFYPQIAAIRERSLALQTIPHWITRENYQNPKPDPECYLQAISRFGKPGDRIIGFEDSARGFQALQGTNALPVLIGTASITGLRYPSFEQIPEKFP